VPAKKKVFVVDDHPVFREGLVRIINEEKDLHVCGEASDASETLKNIESADPDLIIIDISLEGMNGIDLTKSIKAKNPRARILILSMHEESLHAERALKAGAGGYIMKRESGKKLLTAIRRVLEGKTFISPELNEQLLQKMANPTASGSAAPNEILSDRELEVFQLIGQGYGTRQIADELSVSMKTVETHREHIREKLKLKNTFELVQRAIHWAHHEKDTIR
jgi:DNA-binding NarL/FixJ family response regulator